MRYRVDPRFEPLGGASDWDHLRVPGARRLYRDFIFGNDDSSSPPPVDPNIGAAALQNAEIGKEMAALGRDQLAASEARYAKYDPQIQEALGLQMQLSRGQAALTERQAAAAEARNARLDPLMEKSIGLQMKLAEDQASEQAARNARYDPKYMEALDISTQAARDNAARATEQWDTYKRDYRPLEQKQVEDAQGWDSTANLNRARQEAEAGVSRNMAGVRASAQRGLTAMGVNPNSGRFAGANVGLQMAETAGRAGAGYAATEGRRAQGINLRSAAVNVGRGFPATGLTASGASMGGVGGMLNSANAGQNAGINGNAATMAGLGQVIGGVGTAHSIGQPNYGGAVAGLGQSINNTNAAAMLPGAMTGQSLPWYSGSTGATGSAGNLWLGQYGQQVGAFNAQQQADASMFGGLGQAAGTALGLWGRTPAGQAFIGSSEEIKEDKKPVSGKAALAGLEAIPVESWRYKPGEGDGSQARRIGPYAEDVQEALGDQAAPGGVGLDLVTLNGITVAAVKELSKEVKGLKRRLKVSDIGLDLVKPRMARSTEPPIRRVA